MSTTHTRLRGNGFTLVELLVTIVIVSILATALIPLSQLSSQRSKERELREALREIRLGIDAYKLASDEGRVMRKSNESGYPHSLDELVKGVPSAKSATGENIYFLRRIPRDPFYSDRSVPATKTWGLRSYASSYDAPKEGADVFDIFSMSTGVALDGSLYREW